MVENTHKSEITTVDALDAAIADIDPSARVEAVLLTSDRPVRLAALKESTGLDSGAIDAAVDELNVAYERSGRCFRIIRLADGWQMMTEPRMAPVLARLLSQRQHARLSQAAMETLAIVAYRQPILRAEVEAIRGVACGEVLRGLMERRLIRISGRAEELGRPILYGTTRDFLRIFGLSSIEDLPDVDGLERVPSHVPKTSETPDESQPVEDVQEVVVAETSPEESGDDD